MEGGYRHDLFQGTFAEKLMDLLGSMAFEEVFLTETIYRMAVAEAAMIDFLMDKFMKAIVYYDDETRKLDSVSYTHLDVYKRQAISPRERFFRWQQDLLDLSVYLPFLRWEDSIATC